MHTYAHFIEMLVYIFSIATLAYVIFNLNTKPVPESVLSKEFGRYKREKILKNSLYILALFFLLEFVSVFGNSTKTCSENTIDWINIARYIVLFGFVVYIIQILKFK